MAASDSQVATLGQLCAGAGFRRIVYVDDYFDVSTARIESLIDGRSPTELRGIGALNVAEVDDQFIHDAAKKAARAMTEAAKQQSLFDELAAKVESTDARDEDRDAVKAFKTALGNMGASAVLQLSMARWRQRRDQLIADAAGNERTLFIFDDDFSLEGESDTAGRGELAWVRAQLVGKRHATVLLTHSATNEDAEVGIEDEIRKADAANGMRTVVISKEPLQRGTGGLVRRVKYALLQDQFQELVGGKVRAAMTGAAKVAIEAIEKMGVDEFERIIVRSSLVEGAWCPETVTRVVWVSLEKSVRRSLRADQAVHDLVAAIEPLAKLPIDEPSKLLLAHASRLQHLEVVDSATDMDGLFLPLELGDVFEYKSKRYILIAQNCDLAIRSDGERNRDEHRVIALVELQTVKPPPASATAAPADATPTQAVVVAPAPAPETPSPVPTSASPSAQSATGSKADGAAPLCTAPSCSGNEERAFTIANGNVDGSPLTVLFDRVIYVPTWLLDLTVISPTGECELTSATTASGVLQASWRARIPVLQSRIKKEVISLYRKITEPPPKPAKGQPAEAAPTSVAASPPQQLSADDKTRLLRSLMRIPEGCKFQPSVTLGTSDSWTFKVDALKRVQRVRERHATPLLISFMQYAARPAYPHELTKMAPFE